MAFCEKALRSGWYPKSCCTSSRDRPIRPGHPQASERSIHRPRHGLPWHSFRALGVSAAGREARLHVIAITATAAVSRIGIFTDDDIAPFIRAAPIRVSWTETPGNQSPLQSTSPEEGLNPQNPEGLPRPTDKWAAAPLDPRASIDKIRSETQDGGRSSVGRAQGCGPWGRGFEPRRSP